MQVRREDGEQERRHAPACRHAPTWNQKRRTKHNLGIAADQKMDEYKEVKIAAAGKVARTDTAIVARLESKINDRYHTAGVDALINAAAADCWYITENNQPLRGITEIRKRGKLITPADIRFTPVKVAIADSGDLAYAYGYVHYNNKKEVTCVYGRTPVMD